MNKLPAPRAAARGLTLSSLAVVLAAAVLPLACSFIVDFDPAGKPCGNGGACLPGYHCEAGACVSGNDGTQNTPPDAGEVGCSGRCTGTQKCLTNRDECVEAGCSGVVCPVGAVCKGDGAGGTTCEALGTGVGAECQKREDCQGFATGAEPVCLLSGVRRVENGANLLKGFCTQTCVNTTDCTASAEAGRAVDCFQVNGADLKPVKLCLPIAEGSPQTSPRPSYTACRKPKDCADFPGKTCVQFDARAYTTNLGAITLGIAHPPLFCDDAAAGGAKTPAACETDGPGFAESGLCIPGNGQTIAGNAVFTHGATESNAAQPCDTPDDCPADAKTCAAGEFLQSFKAPGTTKELDFVPRRFDMCIKSSHQCQACTSDAECGADAPHCYEMKPGKKFCTSECEDVGGTPFGCDTGATCTLVTTAAPRRGFCVPSNTCGAQ